jgi:hypothetical protein
MLPNGQYPKGYPPEQRVLSPAMQMQLGVAPQQMPQPFGPQPFPQQQQVPYMHIVPSGSCNVVTGPAPGAMPGDWRCTICLNINFAFREACRRCNTPRPSWMQPTERRVCPHTVMLKVSAHLTTPCPASTVCSLVV